jgi:hypothetical protein
MNTCAEIDAICDLIEKHNLPKEQILFMNKGEYKETFNFIKQFGSDGISITNVPNTDLTCHKFQWARIVFYLVNTEK